MLFSCSENPIQTLASLTKNTTAKQNTRRSYRKKPANQLNSAPSTTHPTPVFKAIFNMMHLHDIFFFEKKLIIIFFFSSYSGFKFSSL
jgi:hypothetical protein